MESANANASDTLHRIKRLTQVINMQDVNTFLDHGWVLLQIKSSEYNDVYTIGWPGDGDPVWPDINSLEPKFD